MREVYDVNRISGRQLEFGKERFLPGCADGGVIVVEVCCVLELVIVGATNLRVDTRVPFPGSVFAV